MLHVLPRLMTLVAMGAGFFVSTFFVWQSYSSYKQLKYAAQEAYYESVREPASKVSKTIALVSVPEIFANVNSGEGDKRRMHTLGVKLDVELFDEESRTMMEERLAGVKDAVIVTALEQDFEWLNTMAGKLYFKEAIVARVNEFFQGAIVRDVHFSSFYLQ